MRGFIRRNIFKQSLLSILIFGLSSMLAQADFNDIQLGTPGYGGTGCPAGSVSATLSPDKKELSLLFDQYFVEAGGGPWARRLVRKGCNIAIPVHVPSGFSVSIFRIDYRGFVAIPMGGMARYTAEYFFAGRRGPSFSKYFPGGYNNDYFFRNPIVVTALSWSRCGDDVNLRANTSMLVRTNPAREEALATVDTADIAAGIIYKLQWRRC